MVQDELYRRLHGLVQAHFFAGTPVELTPETQLVGGCLDSVQVFELVELVEQSFGVNFRSDQMTLENLGSLARIHGLLAKMAATDPAAGGGLHVR